QDVAKYRKRRQLVRRRWVVVMTDAGLAKTATDGGVKRLPKVRRIRRTTLGVSVTVDGSPVSAGPAAFRAHADKLQHGFRCREVKVYPDGANVRLDLLWEDPFRHVINMDDLPPLVGKSSTHIGIGLNSDGDVVAKDLRLPNLIVGAKGSGKSSELWAILYALVKAGVPFRLRVFDPKGGQEFAELEKVAHYYERDPTKWGTFVERAGLAMGARQASLRARHIRDLKTFTDEDPLDIMLIDELLTALAFGAGNTKVKMFGQSIKAQDALMVYLSTCRSAGHTVIALSQLGEKNVIGPIRALFDYATCLRVGPTETELVDMMLGSGAWKAYPAHELSPTRDTAGIGWQREVRGVEKYRAGYLTDPQRRWLIHEIGTMTARLRARREEAT
ncbi:MAG TPA: FtsK/SpoIIIE domain-containing protein, partial [Rugosimonospora sp.]|nr:FtsK/SpoIIIE domain-containing protein [Rugosimonospora sp.]